MLHRHQTFKVISNIRVNVSLEEIPFTHLVLEIHIVKREKNYRREINNLKIKFIKKQIPKFIKEKDFFTIKSN